MRDEHLDETFNEIVHSLSSHEYVKPAEQLARQLIDITELGDKALPMLYIDGDMRHTVTTARYGNSVYFTERKKLKKVRGFMFDLAECTAWELKPQPEEVFAIKKNVSEREATNRLLKLLTHATLEPGAKHAPKSTLRRMGGVLLRRMHG